MHLEFVHVITYVPFLDFSEKSFGACTIYLIVGFQLKEDVLQNSIARSIVNIILIKTTISYNKCYRYHHTCS